MADEVTEVERARALTQRADALRGEGKWRAAVPLLTEAAAIRPDDPAAHYNLGVLLTRLGGLQEGERAYRQALALRPGAPMLVHALAHNLLAQGRWQEAWPLYAVRARMPELNTGIPTDFPFPRWRGEPLAGKRLAIFPEQGLGDQIQFARFLPQVQAMGAAITLLVLPPLVDLFRHNFPDVQIVAAAGRAEFPDPDYWTTIYDLPALLDARIDTLPRAPYLRSPKAWPAMEGSLKIGLKLTGNPHFANDATRSLPAAEIERLKASLPGTLVSLEPEESGAADFADTAAMLDQLDLVISVDTSVAHLAGAMGKSCFLLVPGISPDWRWMTGTDRSPWYPLHRLYRGDVDRGWAPAVDRLVRDVRQIADGRALFRQAAQYREERRYSEALASLRKLAAAQPGHVPALHNLARLLTDLGRLREGEAIGRKALALRPDSADVQFGLALNLLAQGRYQEAWPLYAARVRTTHWNGDLPTEAQLPRWAGEDIAGKRIALFPEQGFGDQLQFARFLPWLAARAAEVVLLAPPALYRLFREAFPAVTVIEAQGNAAFPRCDTWAALADLPERAGSTPDNLPDAAYLHIPPPDRTGAGFRIGIMTAGNAAYLHDVHRTLPAEAAAALRAGLPGTPVDLDPKVSGARDFRDTAAIMAGLDVIVSVDTAVGHLAGAMGKPCLLLVPGFATDWRWAGKAAAAWYPRHHLFRGALDGDWNEAIAALCAEARARAEAGGLPC